VNGMMGRKQCHTHSTFSLASPPPTPRTPRIASAPAIGTKAEIIVPATTA
jgi:hypothetical protein